MKELHVITQFSKSPYARYSSEILPGQEDTSGQHFREKFLAPQLIEAIKNQDKLKVVLTGYNRYARSFIDEAFGGLIRETRLTYNDIVKHLEIIHDNLPSIVELAWSRIEKAKNDMEKN
ncbi:STAS-like domain-containing protein [Haemophilus parahaemolyticus]|uniref:STAS-like domain-containing protein n=1 Tax=Haemophilus parahaemolyticus TaxID=735 RepID=UPI0028D77C7E|nr:DUF4325 domain-containing protein [Haemophilus parahaemolyticus]